MRDYVAQIFNYAGANIERVALSIKFKFNKEVLALEIEERRTE